VGHLLYHLRSFPFSIEESIGRTGVNAGSTSLANVIISEELASERLLVCYGSSRANLSAPTAVHAPALVDDGLSFHPQAAVFCQLPIQHFNAGLRADINAQAAVHASVVYNRRLQRRAEIGLIFFGLASPAQFQSPGGADAGAQSA
jgi:hypothetical protein